ncbi:hypothetical protein EV175_006776, partial [Coemansia sp. RSA 1933]
MRGVGFGFVEYEDSNNANVAIEGCNGMPVDGERIVVEVAKKSARKRDDNGGGCFRCGNEGTVPIRDVMTMEVAVMVDAVTAAAAHA